MGERRVALVIMMLAGVTACASSAGPSEGDAASGVPGTVLTGTVQLLEGDQQGCWMIRYEEGGTAFEAPLVVPPGYEAANIAMADPMHPGENYPNPVLMNPAGEPVGFATTGVYVSGMYVDPADARVAEDRERCGWDAPPLLAKDPDGIWLDPDGLTTTIRTCRSTDDGTGAPGVPDREMCTDEEIEPWNLD